MTLSKGIDKYEDYYSSASDLSEIKSKQDQYSWQNNFKVNLGTFTVALDRLEQKISSTYDYQNTSRDSNGYFLGYLNDIGAHSIQANLRLEDSTQYGKHTTGSMGYGYQFNDQWRATASYGTAFKAPTFNDVYAPAGWGANINLKPEESENIEASLRFKNKSSQASITLYDNKITNLILSNGAPYPNGMMINIGKAELKGATLFASTAIESWLLDGSLDFQSAENLFSGNTLPFRANIHGSLHLSKSWENWNFSSEIVSASARYNDSANTQKMAGYGILNFVVDHKINSDWSAQGRLNNLLDKDYALALDWSGAPYNTPGANIFFSLRYTPSF